MWDWDHIYQLTYKFLLEDCANVKKYEHGWYVIKFWEALFALALVHSCRREIRTRMIYDSSNAHRDSQITGYLAHQTRLWDCNEISNLEYYLRCETFIRANQSLGDNFIRLNIRINRKIRNDYYDYLQTLTPEQQLNDAPHCHVKPYWIPDDYTAEFSATYLGELADSAIQRTTNALLRVSNAINRHTYVDYDIEKKVTATKNLRSEAFNLEEHLDKLPPIVREIREKTKTLHELHGKFEEAAGDEHDKYIDIMVWLETSRPQNRVYLKRKTEAVYEDWIFDLARAKSIAEYNLLMPHPYVTEDPNIRRIPFYSNEDKDCLYEMGYSDEADIFFFDWEKYEKIFPNETFFNFKQDDSDQVEMNSPLEAFAVINNYSSFFFNNLNMSIILFFLLPILFLSIFLENSFSFNYNNKLFFYAKKFSSVFFSLFKSLILSIRSERYFFFIISIFLIILTTNLAGFFLLELSITSHAIITLFISFIVFFNYFITSIIINNEKFVNHFLLSKLNYFLMIVLFFIEFTSYFVRPFSLGIRLFANILSGHILIHIFFNAFIFAYSLFLWMSSVVLVMLLFVLTMEIFVSFVQSYIFLILCIIYLQDLNTKH